MRTPSQQTFAAAFVLAAALGASHAQVVVPINIVSIGDSYASGEGAPDAPAGSPTLWRGDNRDRAADGCHRSLLAAPAVAARIVLSLRPGSFTHVACSAATVASLTGTGGQLSTAAGLVAAAGGTAIDALIVSVGGNDVGFAALVGFCLVGVVPGAPPCDPALVATPALIAATMPTLFASLATAVRGLSLPVRHVFVTAYPLPSSTPFFLPDHLCGTPFAPNIPFHGLDSLVAPRAELARISVVDPLNAALSSAVATANAAPPGGPAWHFVDSVADAFNGHGYCMGWPNPHPHMWFSGRYINTLVDSLNVQGDILGTMHPNAAGQAAAGAAIAGAIMASVPIVSTRPPNRPPSDAMSRLCRQRPHLPVCRADRTDP